MLNSVDSGLHVRNGISNEIKEMAFLYLCTTIRAVSGNHIDASKGVKANYFIVNILVALSVKLEETDFQMNSYCEQKKELSLFSISPPFGPVY